MRITVLTGIFPPDIGGPATSVPELVRELSRSGASPTVVTLADSAHPANGDPCPVVRIPRGASRVRRMWEVRAAVAGAKPNVVLANGLHLEAALMLNGPVVQKIVGDWAWERAQNKGWSSLDINAFQHARLPPRAHAIRALRTLVTRRASLVIAPSRYVGDLVNGWGIPKDRIRIVPNAAPAAKPRHGPRKPRALFAGRLVRWKRVDDVLRVLPDFPDLGFDIVGTGPNEPELQELVHSLGLEKRVAFHGALPREVLLPKMAEAACLILPSSYEGMPHVVLEAFAMGLPVVAAAAGGTPEIIESGVSGLLYPYGDKPALIKALRAVRDPGVAERLSHGGAAVAKRLTIEGTVASTQRALVEAAAG
jgi:glycosyltransferase involved in cell wall biosynthesis